MDRPLRPRAPILFAAGAISRGWRVPFAAALAWLLVAFALAPLAGCSSDDGETKVDASGDDSGDGAVVAKDYSAKIRWTEGGVPHIIGATFGDAGFGAGYAFAKLNACLLADQIVKVTSRRAATFGPGPKDANVESDFFELFLGVRAQAEALWPKVHPDVQDLLVGYAAGYNHYLAKVGPSGLPERCRDAAWVQPITALDMFTYVMDLALVASSRALPSLGPVVIHAKPPVQGAQDDVAPGAVDPAATPAWLRQYIDGFSFERLGQGLQTAAATLDGSLFELPGHNPIGSNGIAIGKERSAGGAGLVLGNPHFPWAGELRFWQLHVTVPGVYDVAGAGLSGSPIPNIGFNKDLAWTHTVSKSMKFTAYRLKLVPGKPTSYMYEGQERPMQELQFKVDVKQTDGSTQTISRTYYRSHYGPVVSIGGLAEWTTETAFTIRDANANNSALLEHFLRVGQAKTIAELEAVMATVQGNPWVNTIAADRAGNAFYSESNSVPNLSDATYAANAKAIADGDTLAGILNGYGIFVLDGSVARDEWAVEAGSREPGLVPWTKTPHATRPDYVANANESYWLSHVGQPLPPAAAIFGDRETPRTLRTRVTLHEALDSGEGSASGADGKFTVDELASIPFRARVLSADLALQGALDLCKEVTSVTLSGSEVSVVDACKALQGWDGRLTVQSKGAMLWRETMAAFLSSLSEHLNWDDIFSVPFDPKQPMTTPNTPKWVTSNGKPSKLALALATAVKRLNGAKIPLDGALGDWQYLPRGDKKLPVPGGVGAFGSFNVAGYAPNRDTSLYPTITQAKVVNNPTDLTEAGYIVNYGSSFMMAVTFDDTGPVGKHILTYSQSSEPDSPHYTDETERYGKGQWLDILFHDADIDASAGVKVEDVSTKK